MGRPVVVSSESATGLAGLAGTDYLTASRAEEFADALCRVLSDPAMGRTIGAQARQCVVHNYSWQAHLQVFSQLLGGAPADQTAATGTIQGVPA